jgi:hypothetical protein
MLKKSTDETNALRRIIEEKNDIILKYEAGMGSFRQ